METGEIFLFTIYWKVRTDDLGYDTKAFLTTSTDDGQNWSNPKDVSKEILTTSRHQKSPYSKYAYDQVCGFGPGSGCQMQGDAYKGRLIIPTLQSFITDFEGTKPVNAKKSYCTVYSDDHGKTWHAGNVSQYGGEFQIAECPLNTLIYNLRSGKGRAYATSSNGGTDWSDWTALPFYTDLPTISCQGSIIGVGSTLYCSVPKGGTATSQYDDRCGLSLYKSVNSGKSWDGGQMLYEMASGYSCLTQLKDGRLAILFEAGPKQGFEKLTDRPAGWCRLDLIVIP